MAVVLHSITVCNVPPLNHLTDCNTVYDLPGTAFPDYIFQFITLSFSSLFILSPAHYLRPSIKRLCNFTSLENFRNAILALHPPFFFCRILMDKAAINYGFVRHVTKYSYRFSNPQQYSSACPLVHTASATHTTARNLARTCDNFLPTYRPHKVSVNNFRFNTTFFLQI